jgi:nickel-dependent lactate racemase
MGRQQKAVLRGIRSPIGCPPLRKFAKGKKRILIVTDDNTRQTPLKRILPPVIDELKKAGIKSGQIKILIASGTHRKMTHKELMEKFGKINLSRFKIYNHNWRNKGVLIRINSTLCGKKITVSRLAKESDFIIGIGSIIPHATTGFSGGGKIILPGICGEKTVEDMHWRALDFEMKDILGVYDNPMRRMADRVAKEVGLKFIVNVIMNGSRGSFDVVAGDPVKAHKKGVRIAKRIFGLGIPYQADVVVADARPMDINLRQAIKAVAAADLAVRKGGVIILIARCPEGVSPQFPEFERYGFKDPEGLKRKVEERKIKGKLMAYTLIAIGRILKYKAKVILVSQGISRRRAEKLGFLYADSLKEALEKAKKLTGMKARKIFLKRACEVLPLMN